jgi:hypothetical protein
VILANGFAGAKIAQIIIAEARVTIIESIRNYVIT